MPRDEHQTRVELINPALHDRGWVEALIREDKTPGGTDIIDGKPRKRKGGEGLGPGLAIKHFQKDNGGHHTIWCYP